MRYLIVILSVVVLVGCATNKPAQDDTGNNLGLGPPLTDLELFQEIAKGLKVGMTDAEVESILGEPDSIEARFLALTKEDGNKHLITWEYYKSDGSYAGRYLNISFVKGSNWPNAQVSGWAWNSMRSH